MSNFEKKPDYEIRTDICIRPSSLVTFLQCPWQWFATHILGEQSIPNARAAIGTAIHKGAEVLWTDALRTGKKDANLSMLKDATYEAYKEESAKDLFYDEGETFDTAIKTATTGITTFVSDIVPFTNIPKAVEQRFEIGISDHPIISAVGGTLDYVSEHSIEDLKTSRRKPTVGHYVLQQSTYRLLANYNGLYPKFAKIQGVVLKKAPEGHILDMPIDTEYAKTTINTILDATQAVADGADPKVVFRGNPEYYLCSPKYCALTSSCPYLGANKQCAGCTQEQSSNIQL